MLILIIVLILLLGVAEGTTAIPAGVPAAARWYRAGDNTADSSHRLDAWRTPLKCRPGRQDFDSPATPPPSPARSLLHCVFSMQLAMPIWQWALSPSA
jgi:hypothetical protein